MPRWAPPLITVSAALFAVGVPVAASAVGDAEQSVRSAAAVTVTECAAKPAARSVEFRGVMRSVARTRRMWMRFSLEERVGAGPFVALEAPGLGVWRKSRPGVKSFAYRQGVLELAEGSSYRTVVRYRWYDPEGHLIRRARRTSRRCVQPGPLPNLRVARVGGRPIADGTLVRYTVIVANGGTAGSAATTVSVAVDGATVDTVGVAALAPGERTRVSVRGPRCVSVVEALVDPTDNVRERRERDNSRSIPCPGS